MSEQKPKALAGSTPVYTQGNWFWKGETRFLIKGLSYLPRDPNGERYSDEALIDPLSDEWLPQLREDIPLLQQLGVNTIYIQKIDPRKSHSSALNLLQTEGIHVLIDLFTNFQSSSKDPHKAHLTDYSALDPSRLYTPTLLKRNLAVIDQTADHPNILGYSISAHVLNRRAALNLSAVIRAAVRDVKHYLRLRSARQTPVGVALSDIMDSRRATLELFTASEPEERVDFYSQNCFSWAGNSNFQISGYRNLVEQTRDVPVPMFFSAYGTSVNGRNFSEVECLFSPDMTGVFSGGFMYTYAWGQQQYSLVSIDEAGKRVRGKDFWGYRDRLKLVEKRGEDEVIGQHEVKDYESWRGNVPAQVATWGTNANQVPPCPIDLDAWSQADSHSTITGS